jgi:4'-phosphopantetheinyl transferase
VSAQPLPNDLDLGATDIHVWSLSLDAHLGMYAELGGVLSFDERERALRFHRELDRRRYVIGRGVVRTVLGRYTCSTPRALVFRYNEFGKPFLEDGAVAFNVSHSGGRMLIGLSPGFEIGVDVEQMRGDPLTDRVPERFFSPREVSDLKALAAPLRSAAFFRCWTRKEAFLKGHGEGLSLPLADFDVTLTPGEPAALLHTAWAPDEAKEWRLHDLGDLCAGCAGAVAVHDTEARVTSNEIRIDVAVDRSEEGSRT